MTPQTRTQDYTDGSLTKAPDSHYADYLFWMAWTGMKSPSHFLMLHKDLILKTYPILQQLDFDDKSEHHKEGGVWDHTMHVIDVAGMICYEMGYSEDYEPNSKLKILMYSALLHDIGKMQASARDGNTYAHAELGSVIAAKFMGLLGENEYVTKAVVTLVKHHMILRRRPMPETVIGALGDIPTDLLCYLDMADRGGRFPFNVPPYKNYNQYRGPR